MKTAAAIGVIGVAGLSGLVLETILRAVGAEVGARRVTARTAAVSVDSKLWKFL